MELRVLRYFLTIAREGSITNAANVLHVTQPTLSGRSMTWKKSWDSGCLFAAAAI